MNIAIGNNNRQALMNLTTKTSGSSAMDALKKEKENLENQIKATSQNKDLNQTEKTQKISELQKQLDDLNQRIGQQQLEDMKNSGKEIVENMTKKAEKASTDDEKEENASAAFNYSLISSTADSKDIKKLTGYRKIAMKEEGPNSSRVKRIDNMISDKANSVKENLSVMSRAIQEYSKSKKEELEERNKKNSDELKSNDSSIAFRESNDLDESNKSKINDKSSNVNDEEINKNSYDHDKEKDKQVKEKKFKRGSIDIHI